MINNNMVDVDRRWKSVKNVTVDACGKYKLDIDFKFVVDGPWGRLNQLWLISLKKTPKIINLNIILYLT
jgi:hypothetical protein